jgi:hypothetical protein
VEGLVVWLWGIGLAPVKAMGRILALQWFEFFFLNFRRAGLLGKIYRFIIN